MTDDGIADRLLPALKLNRPGWYAREDFRAWFARPYLAKWNPDPTSEYADCFFWCNLEGTPGQPLLFGSDSELGAPGEPDLPADCKAGIIRAMRRAGLDHAVVWLTNLEE